MKLRQMRFVFNSLPGFSEMLGLQRPVEQLPYSNCLWVGQELMVGSKREFLLKTRTPFLRITTVFKHESVAGSVGSQAGQPLAIYYNTDLSNWLIGLENIYDFFQP